MLRPGDQKISFPLIIWSALTPEFRDIVVSIEPIFQTALCGFLPAPLLALRTLKSETVAGLPDKVAERMREQPDQKWMTTGEYGIAELAR